MKRKIVRQGGSALTVTIPSKWARKYGIDSGDEVEIEERGKELTISTDKEFTSDSREFDTTSFNRFYYHFISYLYHRGYDEVKVIYNNPAVLKTAQAKIDNLMGFEIVETGRNYFIIKNVAMALESEFDVLLRRIFLMLKSMGQDIIEAINAGDYARLDEIKSIERTNDKFTDFCIRILNKKGYKDFRKTTFIYSIVRDLEKIGDTYAAICTDLSGKKRSYRLNKDFTALLSEINNYLSFFYDIFYKFDLEKATDLFEMNYALQKKGEKLLESAKNDKLTVYKLNLLLANIFDMKGPYLAMMI